ncbi:hypothetical protein Q6A83_08495 [Aliarcobacter skirrowii]|uniref:hypothetical protein n=1 Tax=Aliarcobacter skirrowii TaxID=28200 RepID=UPI0029B5300C|nr:hypothetical protein [Aliarcobacter skirrowii]MDX4050806.1 hypothetical protein [Aliarcobacter skirrowii]
MYNFYKIGNKMICRLGEFLFVTSILVLLGSLLFVMVYALFFNNEYEYFDFNNGLLYIGFWVVLLAIGVKIIDKSPNSFLKSDSKETKSKKEE